MQTMTYRIRSFIFRDATARRDMMKRRYERHQIMLKAELALTERMIKLDGMVLEISRGGMLFREATHHILDRRGALISMTLGENEITGRIVNVSASGYGIVLDELISEDTLTTIINSFRPIAKAKSTH